jgi:hypothetical protein
LVRLPKIVLSVPIPILRIFAFSLPQKWGLLSRSFLPRAGNTILALSSPAAVVGAKYISVTKGSWYLLSRNFSTWTKVHDLGIEWEDLAKGEVVQNDSWTQRIADLED